MIIFKTNEYFCEGNFIAAFISHVSEQNYFLEITRKIMSNPNLKHAKSSKSRLCLSQALLWLSLLSSKVSSESNVYLNKSDVK